MIATMEPRRVNMVTVPLETPESKDELAPTIRFTLSLTESNDKTFPEFSYTELLKNASVSSPKVISLIHLS